MSRLRLVSNQEVLANQATIIATQALVETKLHSAQKVYPTLADGVTLTGHATAWTLGSIVEVIPANVIASPFDIHYVNVGAVSVNGSYEVVLYKGLAGAEIEIGRFRTVRIAVQAATQPSPMQCGIMPANTRISAAVASDSGGGDTLALSLFYHTY